jgi:hypothetical protein
MCIEVSPRGVSGTLWDAAWRTPLTPHFVMAGPLSQPSMTTASEDEHHVQVVPMRIVAFDQIDLPLAFILLEQRFTLNRRGES